MSVSSHLKCEDRKKTVSEFVVMIQSNTDINVLSRAEVNKKEDRKNLV